MSIKNILNLFLFRFKIFFHQPEKEADQQIRDGTEEEDPHINGEVPAHQRILQRADGIAAGSVRDAGNDGAV